MNLNTLGYIIYLFITINIIVIIGKICYHNGNRYVLEIVPNNQKLCTQLNKLLLTGYYLVNIGYCTTTLIQWNKISSLTQLIEVISFKSAIIITLLGVLHYFNIYVITHYLNKIIN